MTNEPIDGDMIASYAGELNHMQRGLLGVLLSRAKRALGNDPLLRSVHEQMGAQLRQALDDLGVAPEAEATIMFAVLGGSNIVLENMVDGMRQLGAPDDVMEHVEMLADTVTTAILFACGVECAPLPSTDPAVVRAWVDERARVARAARDLPDPDA